MSVSKGLGGSNIKNVWLTCERIMLTFDFIFLISFFSWFFCPSFIYFITHNEWAKILMALIFIMALYQVIAQAIAL